MGKKNIVKLMSSDGKIFEVDEVVAFESQLVRNIIEDVGSDCPIPLPNVSSNNLLQVIEYCKVYVENQKYRDDKQEVLEDMMHIWPEIKITKVDFNTFYDLIMATNYMQIENLVDLTCQTIAKLVATKPREGIRQIFNIGNDFSNEEEEEEGGGGEGKEDKEEKEQEHERMDELLSSIIKALPSELQYKIKIKVGRIFYNGMWSAWQFDEATRTLVVELAKLYDACDMDEQIANVLMQVDIGLVNILVLQTLCIKSASPLQCERERVQWIEEMDLDLFKSLIDNIDMSKIERMIVDNKTIN